MHKLICFAVATVLLTAVMPRSMYAGERNREGAKTASATLLTAAETKGLLFMREEEKLARDVYLTLHELWGSRVFSNIAQSEQRHMEAMLGLIDKYGLTDPARDKIGIFNNAELQDLYDQLIDKGTVSEINAFYVGALIEEVDLEDIAACMKETDKPDILTVYGNLLAGSENHLAAFVRNIERRTGETYEAQHISQEEVDLIQGR